MTFFDYPDGEHHSEPLNQPFLPNASESDWSDLLRMAVVRRLTTGETLIAPGALGRSMFIVLEGQLEVLTPQGRKWRHVSTVGAGSIVGEIEFFDGAARAGLVRAISDANVAELTRDSLAALQRTRPELAMTVVLDAGRILAQRMRRASG